MATLLSTTINGDLTVTGTTTSLSTDNTVVKDKIIELGNGTSGTPSGDSGIIIERGSSTNAFLGWDESSDKIVLGTTSATGASTGDLTITPTDLNVSDIALTPDGISTSHITTAGSLKIRATNNMHIGDDGADSIRIGRTNTALAKIYIRSGADTDLVVSNSKVGIGTDNPTSKLHVDGNALITGNLVVSGTLDAHVEDFKVTANSMTFGDASGDTLTFNAAAAAVPNGLTFSGGNISVALDLAVDGTANLDNTDIDGTLVVDGSNISLDSTSTLNIDCSNTSNGIAIGTATTGVPVSIGHSTSETTVNDNLTVTGNLTVNGDTTTVSTTNAVISDKLIELANGTSGTPSGDCGIIIERGSSTNAFLGWDESADKIVLGTTSATGASTGDLTITPTDLNVSDIELTPDGITTSHITTAGSLKIRATNNMHIGDDGVDSVRIGRTNTGFAKIHVRSGADTDLVVSNSKVGIGTDSPVAKLDVNGGINVTGSILPGANITYNLGSSSQRFANVYTGDLHLKNERGDWTILEEEDFLCVVNNTTGKKYKMMLEQLPE